MLPIYSGPTRSDLHRGMGYRTISREFTFGPCALTQLRALVKDLASLPSQPTVFELRWKLADAKGQSNAGDRLTKPVVSLGLRAPQQSK